MLAAMRTIEMVTTRFCARGSIQFYDGVEGDSARRVAVVTFRVWPVAGCIA